MNILHCPYRRAIPVEVEYKPLNSNHSSEETMQMIHIEDGHHYARGKDGKWRSAP